MKTQVNVSVSYGWSWTSYSRISSGPREQFLCSQVTLCGFLEAKRSQKPEWFSGLCLALEAQLAQGELNRL